MQAADLQQTHAASILTDFAHLVREPVSAHPGTGLWHPHSVLKIASYSSTPVRAAVPATELTLAERSALQSDRKPSVTLRQVSVGRSSRSELLLSGGTSVGRGGEKVVADLAIASPEALAMPAAWAERHERVILARRRKTLTASTRHQYRRRLDRDLDASMPTTVVKDHVRRIHRSYTYWFLRASQLDNGHANWLEYRQIIF